MFNPVILLFVFSASFRSAFGLTCLSCEEISHPRYCHVVAQCSATQSCYTKTVTTADHRKAFDIGCTDGQAPSSPVCNTTQVDTSGQRCLGCCTTNLCNSALCGEQGYPAGRGPICYSCDSRERGEPCNTIAFCGVGEVCSIEHRVEFGSTIYTAECKSKHVCESHSLAIIGKRSVKEITILESDNDLDLGRCHTCCSEDLCNTNCSSRVNTDHCQSNPCMNGGSCHYNQDSYVCTCPYGWLGQNCHVVDHCQSNPCMNGGSCHYNQDSYVCTCPYGWLGQNCHVVDHCQSNPCLSGGSCHNNQSGYVCTCPHDWLGKNCQIVDHCQNNPCLSGGSCHNNQSGYICKCLHGWLGKNCHIVDHCQSKPCMNGGSCYNNQSGHACTCPHGWLGQNCQTVDRCFVDQPCKYGSTCLGNGTGYSCFCLAGFTGSHCDIGVDCSSFSGASTTSNNSDIYQIWMSQQHVAKRVVCDVNTDGGGWMVIQRRFNGSVSFYRNFSDYEHGFGDLSGEFWMGLRDVQELISCGNNTWELRFDLEDAEGNTGYQTYQDFRLAPRPKYTLHIGQTNGTANRKDSEYYGFTYHNNSDFSTYDHERTPYSCATRDHGGWWYYYCAGVNINGEYVHPPGSVSSFYYGQGGMIYYSFDNKRSLKSTEMKIRRVSGPGC